MKNDVSTPSSRRFDGLASNYAASEVHAQSPTLARLGRLLSLESAAAVCDVACGAGHVALSFAGRARRLVGVDPAPGMLQAFEGLARQRGVAVEAVQARAEALPFAANSFEAVLCRLAAHHFEDVGQAVREMARVARPGGWVGVIDLEGSANPQWDELNDRIERLHDPSHRRSYTAAQWRAFFEAAGLEIAALEPGQQEMPAGLSVARWCEIGQSGPRAVAEIRALLGAAAGALEPLGIRQEQGEFYLSIRTVLIVGRKPSGPMPRLAGGAGAA